AFPEVLSLVRQLTARPVRYDIITAPAIPPQTTAAATMVGEGFIEGLSREPGQRAQSAYRAKSRKTGPLSGCPRPKTVGAITRLRVPAARTAWPAMVRPPRQDAACVMDSHRSL